MDSFQPDLCARKLKHHRLRPSRPATGLFARISLVTSITVEPRWPVNKANDLNLFLTEFHRLRDQRYERLD